MMEKRSTFLIALLLAALAFFTVAAGLWSPKATSPNPDGRPDAATVSLSQPAPSKPAQEDEGASSHQRLPDRSPSPASNWDALTAFLHQRLDSPGVVPGEALLSFRNPEALNRFLQQAAANGLGVLGTIPQLNALRIHYGTLDQLRGALAAASSGEVNVEGNPWLTVPSTPPQPDPNNQHGAAPFGYSTLDAINAAGNRTNWGNNVTVAVLDTGVLAHPTFGASQVTHLDLVNDGQPFDSHGTSVASLIAGKDPQAPGVAPGAQILDVRVAGNQGYTVGSLLAQGIVTATDSGAQVINISLGGYGESAVLDQSLNYAFQHGVLVVAAAGNESYNELAMPAAYPGVISVGSVDANGEQAYFSNSGQGLGLTAPGVGVVTAWSTDQLALASGTSQSSALVAGATAAYLGWGIPSANVTARLKADARSTGAPATQVGAGVLMIKPPAGR